MTDVPRRRSHLWPRNGIMASAAGRRVVLGAFQLAAGALAVAGGMLCVATLVALRAGYADTADAREIAWGVGGGVAVVVLAFAILPVLARFSRLGEEMSLLELCDPGAPLLRELRETAGGTYNHSMMVGAMAEAAARRIGADALLVRVGAYYHDVGKLARPYFFAENQSGLRNPHDAADPEQSAFVITAHVREGVAMAREAGLPRRVLEMIEEHHGTSVVTYFYRKAAACGGPTDQARFRYDGVLPHTREAGVVMIADSAEAAVRGLTDTGPARIEATVRRVVQAKVDDGQLAESGLSGPDVEESILACAKMLAGLRHSRVSYPDDSKGESDAGDCQLES